MRRLLFLTVMALALTAQVSLFEMYGSLQSPNFPEPYPRETQLRWNVSVPDGFQVQLYFSHFDLEPSYLCEYDFVKVEAEGEVLGLFCGRSQTDTEAVPDQQFMTSPTNSLSVVFTSDFSNEERHSGFMAHYKAVDVDECSERSDEDLICDHFCHNYIGGYYCSCRYGYLLHTDNRTCRVECSDGVFRERSGVLSSVDFPAPYPKSSECLYRIEAEPGFKLRLEFDPSFDVEDHPDVRCPYDYVKITAGRTQFGPFCGSSSPGILQTDSNIVFVTFHSDNSGENLGWKMTYTATGSQCPVPERPSNAVMNPVQSEYFFKDHVLFTCSPGYKLMKDAEVLDHLQLDCGSDGTWSSRPPQCELVDCGKPTAVERADLVFGNHDNSTLFGSTVHYVCRGDTFHLNTINTSFSCGHNGQWTNPESGAELPSCLHACGRPSRALPPQVKRIVGGRGAAPGLFPWHVLLSVEDTSRVPEGRWFGSGALLSDSWVLTAAHVLRSQRRDASVVPVAPEHVKVFLGVHDARDKRLSSHRSVERVVLHPDFTPDNYNHDIALLKLASRVELNDVIRPICLPPPQNEHDPSSPLPNSLGIVAGWGISVPNATSSSSGAPPLLTSDLLQYVKLPVVPQDECRASYASRSVSYNITENMFCAGYFEGGRDTCMGDSGGAFVMEDKVSRRWMALGLVSWGGPEECGSQRVYGVYTRVTKYVEWIQQHLQAAPWW